MVRMRDYHTAKAGSHSREAAWFASVEAMMEAAGLGNDALVKEVLSEAGPESIAV